MLNGWYAQTGTLGATNVATTVAIAAATGMGAPADHLLIVNRGSVGQIAVTFSQNGDDFTAGSLAIASNRSELIRDCNVNAIQLSGSISSVTYSLAAWRNGRNR